MQKIITVLTIVAAACTGSSQWAMWSDGGISLSLSGGGSAISVTATSDHLDNAYNFGAGRWLEGGNYLVRASLDSGLAANQIGVRLSDDSGATCYAERRAVVLGEVATFILPATSCHNFTVGAHTYGPDDVGYSGTLQIQMIGLGTE